jgi:hypothetical protein
MRYKMKNQSEFPNMTGSVSIPGWQKFMNAPETIASIAAVKRKNEEEDEEEDERIRQEQEEDYESDPNLDDDKATANENKDEEKNAGHERKTGKAEEDNPDQKSQARKTQREVSESEAMEDVAGQETPLSQDNTINIKEAKEVEDKKPKWASESEETTWESTRPKVKDLLLTKDTCKGEGEVKEINKKEEGCMEENNKTQARKTNSEDDLTGSRAQND